MADDNDAMADADQPQPWWHQHGVARVMIQIDNLDDHIEGMLAAAVAGIVSQLQETEARILAMIGKTTEEIMSEQSIIDADVATLNQLTSQLQTAFTEIQAEIKALSTGGADTTGLQAAFATLGTAVSAIAGLAPQPAPQPAIATIAAPVLPSADPTPAPITPASTAAPVPTDLTGAQVTTVGTTPTTVT